MDALLIDAVRTPFGRYRGGLSGIRTDDLAAAPIGELLRRHPDLDPAAVDDVLLGNTNGAGEENRNVGRMAALLAGLPVSVPGATVNRLCASGGEAIVQGARAVAAGDARAGDRWWRRGDEQGAVRRAEAGRGAAATDGDGADHGGLAPGQPGVPAAVDGPAGRLRGAGRRRSRHRPREQDEWALRSHERAAAAWDKGLHDDYVAALGDVVRDESIRPDTSLDRLAALPPAFSADGTVTAGNSSPLNDGAIACLLGSAEAAAELGVTPLGRLLGSATVGVEPDRFTLAPVPAIEKVLARVGLTAADIDVWEINEAFAAMVLSCLRGLPGVDVERVNPHGGAIAIGHPLGASAPRVIVDLCRELRRRGGGIGVAAACVGVGQGTAVVCRVDG